MREKEVLERAFAMPLTSPAYPPGPYRFVNREYLIITYRTDPAKLRAVVPEPLELDEREALVKYEFIRMPDSNGFGDYTESGQVIPVSFRGRKGSYTHCMFLNDEGPIAGGRELWGFPKKLAQPTLRTEIDTLVGTLDYGPLRVATGTMGYKHRASRSGASQSFACGAEFSAQDHSACRRHAAHLRTRRISSRGCHDKGRVDRARGAPPVTPRFGTRRRIAGSRDRVRDPHPCRPYARPRQGRARLSPTAKPTSRAGPRDEFGRLSMKACNRKEGRRKHRAQVGAPADVEKIRSAIEGDFGVKAIYSPPLKAQRKKMVDEHLR